MREGSHVLGVANGLMTMDLLDLTWEDMIDDGLKEPAGAATALAEAQDTITLII
jgi:peroxiredoxin family protein